MVSRGASASDDEVSEIVAYLTKHYGKLNINTATQPQSQEGLRFTDQEAQAIATCRDHNGAIKDFEQLKTMPGLIPEKSRGRR